jgi:TatD DNase family protein
MVQVPELYDTHCHLDFSEFEDSRDVLLEACYRERVSKLLVPSVSRNSWSKVQGLTNSKVELSYALGLHPLFIEEHYLTDLESLANLISLQPEGLVALGEIGLDADAGKKEFQEELFVSQLELAEEYSLPVIMHARRTHSSILSFLKQRRVEGVIHAFSGGEELLKQYIAKGVYIGVGCVITWPSAKKTRASIAKAPIDRLVLETDSPDMKVYGVKDGQLGSPLAVRDVFSALCEIRKEEPDVLAAALRQNADRLFFQRL